MFDINRFRVSEARESYKPKVFVPKGEPFRIHPAADMCHKHFWLAFYRNQWYLLDEEVAENRMFVPEMQIWMADLYFGVLKDGTAFWMPVTYPSHPEYASWRRSLLKIVRDAQEDWMVMVTDSDSRQYVGHKSSKSFRLVWPKDSAECLLEHAFRGRIMDENHPCMSQAERREVATVIEE